MQQLAAERKSAKPRKGRADAWAAHAEAPNAFRELQLLGLADENY